MSYWVLVGDRDTTGGITSFTKWEVAFRVLSNIYTAQYPFKSSELLQYCHVIYTASLSYIWENIYNYDHEFRLHMSRHPQRSWSVILQQAWNLRLKDKLKHENYVETGRPKVKEECKRFNKRKCHLGNKCRYEHKCLGCGKFGHAQHICRQKEGKTAKRTPDCQPSTTQAPEVGTSN